jgi:hypothetical protein
MRARDDNESGRPYGQRMTRAFTENPYIRRLRAAPLLSRASAGELRAVAQVAEHLDVTAGAVLAAQGVRWRGAYVAVDGSAAVISAHGASLCGPGAALWVGDDTPTVVAVTPMIVLAIAAREWRALRALAPGVTRAIERACSAEMTSVGSPCARDLAGRFDQGAHVTPLA